MVTKDESYQFTKSMLMLLWQPNGVNSYSNVAEPWLLLATIWTGVEGEWRDI